MSTLKSCKQVL